MWRFVVTFWTALRWSWVFSHAQTSLVEIELARTVNAVHVHQLFVLYVKRISASMLNLVLRSSVSRWEMTTTHKTWCASNTLRHRKQVETPKGEGDRREPGTTENRTHQHPPTKPQYTVNHKIVSGPINFDAVFYLTKSSVPRARRGQPQRGMLHVPDVVSRCALSRWKYWVRTQRVAKTPETSSSSPTHISESTTTRAWRSWGQSTQNR